MKTNFPQLHEIASSARVSISSPRGLAKEQWAAQEELRSQFHVQNAASGIVLPWYANDREARDMTVTGGSGGNQGGMTVGRVVPEIGAALRDNLVLEKMGARVLGGLREDVGLPRASTRLATVWRSENAASAETDETLSLLNLTPKRVTAYIDVSDKLLRQRGAVEPFLRSELMAAIAVEVQRVAIAGTGTSDEPTGILATSGIGDVAGGANGLAPTLAHLCSLEFAVTGTAKADRGNTGWLCSPAVRRKLRQTFLNGPGSAPIWSATEASALLGRPGGVTPSVPDTLTKGSSSGVCSAILFGEMSELFLCFWGPGIIVEAVRDVASAKLGLTQLFATLYFDCGVRSPEAFAAMKDALAA